MQAAVGCAQLEKLPEFVERRRHNFDVLYDRLSDLKDRLELPEVCEHSKPSWFGFPLTCREGIDRKRIVSEIESMGIQTRMLFAGNLTRHPCFDEMRASGSGYRAAGKLTNTERIMKDTFWVGVYPGMTEGMLEKTAGAVRRSVIGW